MATVANGKTAVLLIVEDDREMRSLLCDEFCGMGYQLREARDGDEAFLAVRQSVPDAILKAGANAYFDKPVHIAELKSCVQQLLNHKGM